MARPWTLAAQTALTLLLVGLWAAGCDQDRSSRRASSQAETDATTARREATFRPTTAAASGAGDDGFWQTRIDTVRSGDTFGALLLRNDVHVEEAGRIIEFIREHGLFSLRRLRVGETVRIRRDGLGGFGALQYEKSPDAVFVVERVGDSLGGYVSAIDYDLFLREISGVISSSVEEAIAGAGGNIALTVELATILAFEIDFLTEPRRGDSVCLLVEEKWLENEFLGNGRIRYLRYGGEQVTVEAAFFGGDPQREESGYFTPEGESITRAFLRSPLNYRRISSRFSHRRFHPILRKWRPHLGVDYAAPSGTPVVAVGSGTVILAAWNGGFGRQVKIRHGSVYETWYAHLSRFASGIRQGTRVDRGQVIGAVGATGIATGPHLDFRVAEHGRFIDPLRMQNPREEALEAGEKAAFREHVARLVAICDSLENGGRVHYEPPPVTAGLRAGG